MALSSFVDDTIPVLDARIQGFFSSFTNDGLVLKACWAPWLIRDGFVALGHIGSDEHAFARGLEEGDEWSWSCLSSGSWFVGQIFNVH
jgi:hypothetical protein